MFPSSWIGWTSDLADLVRVPVTPVSHVGMMLTNWVRPGVDPSDLPTDEQERNDLAIAERDHFRQLYHAQMLRATELADQLRLLQSLPESALLNPQPPIVLPLDVTGINPSDTEGLIELKLIRGARERVLEGDIAIVGRDIVGRISRIGITRVEMRPTSHQEIGLIRAAVVPSHVPQDGTPPLRAEILVRSIGDGTMYAESPTASDVQVGDLVVLDDPSWPLAGSGLVLGSVLEVQRLDEAPLREVLIIAPRRTARGISKVVVLATGEVQSQ